MRGYHRESGHKSTLITFGLYTGAARRSVGRYHIKLSYAPHAYESMLLIIQVLTEARTTKDRLG